MPGWQFGCGDGPRCVYPRAMKVFAGYDDFDDRRDLRAVGVWGTRVHARRRGTVSSNRDSGARWGPVPGGVLV